MDHAVVDRFSRTDARLTSPPFIQLALAVPLLALCAWLGRAWLRPLTFDDAYMFYRYALNIRDGLGIAWNPDGVPTYGMTSQLWAFFIVPLTFTPLTLGHALQLASWLAGSVALVTLTAAVARQARSPWLRRRPIAFAVVTLPLVLNPIFAYHLTTGMDTMLSLWANSLVVLVLLDYMAEPTTRRSLMLGCVAVIAVLSRPDSGLCALGAPLLAWLTRPGARRWRDLRGLVGVPVALIGLELLLCDWYFQAPLPLGFYAKSLHVYAGFTSHENAVQYAYLAAAVAVPFVAALLVTARREQMRLVLVHLLPAALTLAYLLSVRQVMGFVGRYYLPLVPFVVAPAFMSLDAALLRGAVSLRRLTIAVLATAVAFVVVHPFEGRLERAYTARVVPPPIAVPALPVASLPKHAEGWYPTMPMLGAIIASLPSNAVVASSEVGYISAAAPHTTIIDLVGLNDTRIGLHGFSMDELLARAPDLIWLPHTDYSGLRAAMLSDTRLYDRYEVIAQVFNYGVAIRRDSPYRAVLEERIRAAWSRLYPAARLAQFVVPDGYVPHLAHAEPGQIHITSQ